MALEKVTALRMAVKWARMLINSVGKSRPSVVNILEGSRLFELQIWWEILPWLADVYPVYSNAEAKNPKEEEDGGARATLRVGFLFQEAMMLGRRGRTVCQKMGDVWVLLGQKNLIQSQRK